jgi:alkanesulfonate monooxygenase SsuD/methylene tetrahydromethanopterin reductase-like flavin-dependent oxidoreductase (luciferase family)
MAGEVADGVHVHPFHSMRYLEEVVLPAVREGAAGAGRDPADVSIVCPVMAIIGETEEERARARDDTRLRIAFYGSTRTYAGVFDLHGWEGTSERLHDLQRAGDLQGMAAAITDEMLDVYSLETTWDGLADALHDKYDGVADRVVMYDATGGWEYGTGALDRWRGVTESFRLRR